jgi:hypothetical protein
LKVRRGTAAGVVLVAALAATGVAAGAGDGGSQAHAKADAARQLSELVLPAGATEVSSDPSASANLDQGPSVPVSNRKYLVDEVRYWTVPGRPGKVASWMQAHPPANAPGSYGGSPASGIYSFGWTFTYTPRVTLRSLDVQVTRARGGGSAVRGDGVAVWVPPRPDWDHVPQSVHVMTIRSTTNGHTSSPTTVRDAHDVRRVVRFLNQAWVVAPISPRRCPREDFRGFRLTFQAERSGPVLARSRLDPGGVAISRCPSGAGVVRLWSAAAS